MVHPNHPRMAIVGVIAALGLTQVLPATAQVYSFQSSLGTTGSAGSDNTHFNGPVAGTIDTVNGHFFVPDWLNQRVQVFSTATLAAVSTIGQTGVPGSDNAHFNLP